jgi:benzodiazapine receptor
MISDFSTLTKEGTVKDILRQFLVIVTFAGMVTVNALANILPINGLQTGQVSDSLPIYFVPAGYVFSIWGLIYLALGAFTVYQALPSQRENPAARAIGGWFILSNVVNGAWIFAWHYLRFTLSLVLITVLLILLILIYLRLDQTRKAASTLEKWVVYVPFSIYLGWITVAAIANASGVLYNAGWDGFGIAPQTWAVVMLVIAGGLASFITLTRRETAYTLVILWALAGIVVRQINVQAVAVTAGVMAGAVALALIVSRLMKRTPAGA